MACMTSRINELGSFSGAATTGLGVFLSTIHFGISISVLHYLRRIKTHLPGGIVRYSAGSESQLVTAISEKYSLPPNPQQWPFNVSPHVPEPDDDMHDPDTKNGKLMDTSLLSSRGWKNYGCLLVLLAAVLMLFVGYPILTYIQRPVSQRAGYNLGGINASRQALSIS
ncbi:hypothetical protein MPER_11733 [Moniliophthora perniciosa FA553]|nr:hypothetical protein MPER_11733 [Moniliophthora perniciosa FA553]